MSARGIIEQTLNRYGLGSLGTWAWNLHLTGTSIEEVMLQLRQRKEYKARFPAMQQLGQEGRAISEESYMQFESTIRSLVSQHGLPMNIYGGRDYVAQLLIADISPPEAQRRMQVAEAASVTAPEQYREEAARLYGISAAQWASIWLETDRTLPELERMYASSAIAGEATIRGLEDLSRAVSERIANTGASPEQARQALGSTSRQLASRLPGEAEAGLGVDALALGAFSLGPDADRLIRRRRQRIAQFAGSGGVAATQRGLAAGTAAR